MKHFLTLLAVLLMGIFSASAQQAPAIPIDSKVKTGRLKNGLTYYIRENKLPEARANFYIVQKVGSIQEEDNQRGLAHFLEHMAFNGSKNFPADGVGKSMISYLESIGVKFGANLNAATGMDQTIYNINDVPVNTPDAVENCLLILHDWSSALLLREKDIDKERKVIHEEWRTGQNAQMRILEKTAPAIFKGSRYAYRLPIGTMEVIDNFEPQVLHDYYKKWYRPDLQGIIIVGDINADEIEKQIKDIFSSIPAPVNPAERKIEIIPENESPIVAIGTDKEFPANNIVLSYKRNPIPYEQKKTMDYYVYPFASEMIVQMLNTRLEEIMQKPDSPFAFALSMNGPYFGINSADALQVIGVAKPNATEVSLATLLREVKRAKDFGFTAGEFERAKANYMSSLEKVYNERKKMQNSYYIQQYINHFLNNEPIPSIEDQYGIINQIIPHISVEVINQLIQHFVSDKNRVVVLMGMENNQVKHPTENEIQAIIKKSDSEELTAYEDKTISEPLMSQLPTSGKIISEKIDAAKGTTVWELENGARVIVKTTDFKEDEILLHGFALGGSAAIDDEYVAEIKIIDDVATVGGLGKFSATDLRKNLAGKNANIQFKIDTFNEQISGSSNVKDLETMMQLLYLNFTDIRKDDTVFESTLSSLKGILPTLAANPEIVFNDSLMKTIYLGNPRFAMPTVQELDAVSYDKILELFKTRFANAGNFTFSFVGNIASETLKPFVEQYIASLPGKRSEVKVNEIPTRKGVFNNHFTIPLETPKATTAIIYTGDMEYSLQNILMLNVLQQLFQMEFTEKVREKHGGTYGVRVHAKAEKLPTEGFTLQFQFDTDPVRRTELVDVMNNVVADMQQNGPNAEMLNKIKEFMLKQHTDNLKENGYVLKNIWQYYVYGIDLENSVVKYVNELSISKVQQFTQQVLGQNNRLEISMTNE